MERLKHDPVGQREPAAYHEGGHAVITLCLGGIINEQGVEIDLRQECGCCFHICPEDSKWRELTQVLVFMAGWRAEHLHHGRGGPKSDRNDAELDYIIWEV